MRNLLVGPLARCRVKSHLGWGDETCGAFKIESPIDGAHLRVIASCGAGWDHVSVSRKNRTPNYPEMVFVKNLFFRDDETVMELHVPSADHVNLHPNCLHLWRPQNVEIPRPPAWMVGPTPSQTVAESVAEGMKAQKRRARVESSGAHPDHVLASR